MAKKGPPSVGYTVGKPKPRGKGTARPVRTAPPEKLPRSIMRHAKGAEETVAAAPKGLKVRVVVHPAEEGGFWAEVPALPGCMTQGDTREELLANLREAVEGYLLAEPVDFEQGAEGWSEEIEL